MKSVAALIGKAYGGLSPSIWLLALSQFINRAGTMVIFFLAVYLKDHLHFDLDQVGIAMAMFGAGSLAGVYISGKLVDKTGYYPIMWGSLLSGGILFIAVSFITEFYALCAGLFLLAAIGESFRPAGMVAISHYSSGDNYTRSISLYRLAINLGFSIGPAIGGLLAAQDYRWIFWADGASGILAAIFLILFLRKSHQQKQDVSTEIKEEDALRFKSPLQDYTYMIFLFVVCIYALTFFQFFSTMSIYYKNVELMSEGQIGIVLALNGVLVAVCEMLLIYKIEKKKDSFYWIMLGSLLLVFSYLMLQVFHGMAFMIVLTVVISFSEMFAMPFMNTFMNQRAPASLRGRYASMYVMAWSVAQISIPILATQTIQHLGFSWLWWILTGTSLLVIWLNYLVKKRVNAGL